MIYSIVSREDGTVYCEEIEQEEREKLRRSLSQSNFKVRLEKMIKYFFYFSDWGENMKFHSGMELFLE